MQVDIRITDPNDTVVVEYPPEWRLKVLEHRVSDDAGSRDPLALQSCIGIKVAYAPLEAQT